MAYLKQVLHNLKEAGNIFTIIGVLLGLLLSFKSFSQEILVEVLKAKWILAYFYLLLLISLAIIGTCFLQPLFLSRRFFALWRHVIQWNRSLGNYSFHIFYVPLALMFFGIVIIYSFTRNYALLNFGNASFFATKQVWWISMGSVVMFTFAKIKYTFFKQVAFPFMMFVVILLFAQAVSLLPSHKGIAEIVPYFRFNYWETTKFAFIIYVAKELTNNTRKILWVIPIFVVFTLIGFIEGKAGLGIVLILAINGILMIVSKHSARMTAKTLAVMIIVLSAVISIFVYQKSEVLGGFFGVGFGRGISNSISSQVIGYTIIEEWGFLGALLMLALFNLYCLIGIKISIKAENSFGRLLIIGIVGVITLQTFQYILMIIGITPITTITLPFISYGWSQIIMNLGLTGIIMNISYCSMTSEKNTINT
jgi:cell division protein FtsW